MWGWTISLSAKWSVGVCVGGVLDFLVEVCVGRLGLPSFQEYYRVLAQRLSGKIELLLVLEIN